MKEFQVQKTVCVKEQKCEGTTSILGRQFIKIFFAIVTYGHLHIFLSTSSVYSAATEGAVRT